MRTRLGALPRFIALYALLYAGFGAASAFVPAFMNERGVPSEQLGILLAAGTAISLLSAPFVGRIADLIQNLRLVLAICVALGALVAFCFLPAHGFWALLLLYLTRSVVLAPPPVLADALALGAASQPSRARQHGFEYGWVRGSGSAAFIVGTLASGQCVAARGLEAILVLQALLLGAAVCAVLVVPELAHGAAPRAAREPTGGVLLLLRIAAFRRLMLAAALVLGSHALHDGFAVIRWRAAGIGPSVVSALWSESVAAEVIVFFALGPRLVTRLTPAGAIALAAIAGVVRWLVMGQTTELFALALVQPLHGITFALLHLASMRLLTRIAPKGLEATAQAVYGTFGIGAAQALLSLASGFLYARVGAQAFWVMAGLCVIALPAAWRLRQAAREATTT